MSKLEWKDIGAAVGRIAPILGTALGGPAGGAIGALVSTALGVGNSADEVEKALTVDPNAAIKLKQLQVENDAMLKKHIEAMATIELEYERSRVDERKSAHLREAELAKAGKDNTIQPALAIIAVGAFFAMVWYMLSYGLLEMSKEASFIIGNVIGIASAIAKDVYGYYFGSSKGSKDKTIHLSQNGIIK